jgi:hypothetical protein
MIRLRDFMQQVFVICTLQMVYSTTQKQLDCRFNVTCVHRPNTFYNSHNVSLLCVSFSYPRFTQKNIYLCKSDYYSTLRFLNLRNIQRCCDLRYMIGRCLGINHPYWDFHSAHSQILPTRTVFCANPSHRHREPIPHPRFKLDPCRLIYL